MKINSEKLFLRDVKGSKLKSEENLKVGEKCDNL